VDSHGVQAYFATECWTSRVACYFSCRGSHSPQSILRVGACEHVRAAATLRASAELIEVGLHWPLSIAAAVAADDLYAESEHRVMRLVKALVFESP